MPFAHPIATGSCMSASLWSPVDAGRAKRLQVRANDAPSTSMRAPVPYPPNARLRKMLCVAPLSRRYLFINMLL